MLKVVPWYPTDIAQNKHNYYTEVGVAIAQFTWYRLHAQYTSIHYTVQIF